jgi:hypothetical protein
VLGVKKVVPGAVEEIFGGDFCGHGSSPRVVQRLSLALFCDHEQSILLAPSVPIDLCYRHPELALLLYVTRGVTETYTAIDSID